MIIVFLVATASGVHAESRGFPADFPVIKDRGGSGLGTLLTGLGGDKRWKRNKHRKVVKRAPIILLHGNGTHATAKDWGVMKLRNRLIKAGYFPAEIWAVSYLGRNNSKPDMPNPHSANIEDIRTFIDAVIDYTGAKKVNLIGHSLGGNLARSYILGLNSEGKIEDGLERFDKVRSLITLSASHHGLGLVAPGEFKTGSAFEKQLHSIKDVFDETPFGPSKLSRQIGKYLHISKLDNDKIRYAGLWAKGDFVDIQNPGTGRLKGANINKAYSLGSGMSGHKKMLTDPNVFEDILTVLK